MDLVKIKPLLETKLKSLGYDLISINFKSQKGDKVLELIVDRVSPIDMNAIVEVSGAISSYLDEIDGSNDPYTLDVSSLGAEKPLKVESLKNYVGSYVHVHLTNPIEGENILEGTIESVTDDSFTLSYKIKTRVKTVIILLSNIYKIRLAIK